MDPPKPEQKKQSWYSGQYEKWMPWIEDQYLRWFTNDNKTSYSTKQNLDKTKVTGIDQVDKLQDQVNSGISGQFGKDGLGEGVGKFTSKEGANRMERQGKDDKGQYAGDPTGMTGSAVEGGKAVAGKTQEGLGAVSNTVGGLLGGGQKQQK